MPDRPVALLALLALLAAAPAALARPGGELIMLAPLDQTMPIAQFQNGALSGGMLKDLGDALAQRLGRRAGYLSVDVDGVTPALTEGRADAMCYVLPNWIVGDYHWSRPLIPDAELIVSSAGAAPISALSDLRDKPIGTVAGYHYPRVEQVLGKRFVRRDTPSMELNLKQMGGGTVPYTIIGQNVLAYQIRRDPSLKVHSSLVFASYKAQCAMSRRARVPFGEINRALDALVNEGRIEQILARYQ